ncbi:hypothetical protein [Pedobacter endophyticus]|uniref:Uncharacterized protein n=1 Tax=Pedobacter endophyticus TaxID=2789740 RepID=A0A7U3Q3L2_9SPHI|nr:hypothetical protein [Pedobacter endophyticus]QPH37887.1 hypothetical protein IZT61_12275 [Pedobacter endophyticus]
MEELTKKVLEELKRFDEFNDTQVLQQHYKAVLDAYIVGNYPMGFEGETLMCSIHEVCSDDNSHNCVGCNLQEQSSLIIRFLSGYASFASEHAVSIHFHMLLYLLAERYNQYIEMMDIPIAAKSRHFKIFQKVIHWANFIKHPKAFVLVHHPQYFIDGIDTDPQRQKERIHEARENKHLIDDSFVSEYYAGSEHNGKLMTALAKKENVIVLFPDPLQLIESFVKAQQEFVSLIVDNKVFREIITNKANLRASFSQSEA